MILPDADLDARIAAGDIGTGQPFRCRTDHYRGFYDLDCDVCDASWLGPVHEPCPWCITRAERHRAWQIEKDLEPPEVDYDDWRWRPAMEAWKQRLVVAIRAGRITADEARHAFTRGTKRRTT